MPRREINFFLAIIAVGAVAALIVRPSIRNKSDDQNLLARGSEIDQPDGGAVDPGDADFERFVRLNTLGAAWTQRDSEMMTDITLQLMEGERVLQRCHSAISSTEVGRAALWLASDNNDEPSRARLARVKRLFEDTSIDERVLSPELIGKLEAFATRPAHTK